MQTAANDFKKFLPIWESSSFGIVASGIGEMARYTYNSRKRVTIITLEKATANRVIRNTIKHRQPLET